MSIEVLVPDISYDTNIQVLAFGTKLEINSQKNFSVHGHLSHMTPSQGVPFQAPSIPSPHPSPPAGVLSPEPPP